MKWEVITSDVSSVTERLKVPGGWIIRTSILHAAWAVHQIFISDPNWEWSLKA